MAEASLIMTADSSRIKDKDLRAKAFTFLQKLTVDDAAPGLHIEPIHGVRDSRVRTGRVDLAYRAVLFRLDHEGQRSYVVHGIWHHDEAIARAKRATLRINPLNGIVEIDDTEAAPPDLPPPVKPVVDATPAVLGYTAAELIEGLGLAPGLAQKAEGCTSESLLLDYAEGLPEWQGLALIELASGSSMEDVRQQFGLEATPDAESTDEEILDSIRKKPASQATFTYLDNTDELRRMIETGSFAAWRTWLHPKQRRLVSANYQGAYRLAGGAGTGKTVVLLHRARRLATEDPAARIVLSTFTTNLAEQLRQDITMLDPDTSQTTELGRPGILVLGIDALASAVLKSAEPDALAAAAETLLGTTTVAVAKRRDAKEAWERALAATDGLRDGLPEGLATTAFVSAEYTTVVLPNRIVRRQDYVRVPRAGRGVRLSRPQRLALWEVFTAYRAQRVGDGGLDFGEAAALAGAYLDRRAEAGAARPFDHVVVDEGQDLGPCHLQFVRALVEPGPNDVFLAEDAHQRIYGQRLVLSRFGLQVRGRSSRLTLNYRTTAQNLGLAQQILEGADWVDGEDQEEDASGYRSVRRGPAPRIVPVASLTAEYDLAAETLSEWLAGESVEPETLAILVRDQWQREQVVAALAERGVRTRAIDRGKVPAGLPVVLTMHRAKGTEFAKVLLLGVSENKVPTAIARRNPVPEERDEALLRERALLYVAASRARDELVISYSGAPSPLLP